MNFNSILLIRFFGILAVFVTNTVGREAIIDGEKATVDQFPYQVSVQRDNGHLFCGGGIIGDKFILTAAHCFLNEAGIFADNDNISVVAGTNDRYVTNPPAMVVKVQRIYVPVDYILKPQYRPIDDVAVLRLEKPLKLSEHVWKHSKHIRKLQLPKHKHDKYDGKIAKIAGYGWDWIKITGTKEDGGHTDSQLRFAEVDVFNHKQCAEAYEVDEMVDPFMCAKIKHHDVFRSRSTCYGDSGGPLVYENTVIGILSHAPIDCTERNRPAMYIAVSDYLDFIADAMKDKKKPEEIYTYDVKH